MKKFFCFEKKRAAAAIIATAAMLIVTGLAAAGEGMGDWRFWTALALSLGGGIFVLLNVSYGWIVSLIAYLLLPAAAFCALENYTHVLTDFDPPIVVLNLIFFYLLYAVTTLIAGSVKVGFVAATLVPMLFGLANYYVVSFRSSPIVPWDFLSLGTAMSVADNYSFTLTWKAGFVVIAFIWIMVIAGKSRVKIKRRIPRFCLGAVFAALMFGYISAIQLPDVQSFFGMDTTLFTLNVLYRNNGIAAAFLGNLRFLNIQEPSGYSVEKVEELTSGGTDDGEEIIDSMEPSGASTPDGKEGEYPNIVVVMDEAFSDLSVWGDFVTSEEVMPCFKSLQEEAVGGELYVSVKGGNTANTEFEFLTGNTMGFLPTGSVPYQQYINGKTPSLASYLKTLGYQTTAIHPYNASGWDRDEVYEYFGFDEFLDRTDFVQPITKRGYISDQSAFEKIVEQFENKKPEDKLFVFEVTMQNHGGYSKASPDFTSYVKLPEVAVKTLSVTATEKYLTLMHETDLALQEMVDYFKSQDEPVIVVMFGDHQPSDYITNVIQRICGVQSEDTLEFMQQGYRVPFFIWSNYGLEHQYYDGISVNYLGGILMDNAGIPLTGYQSFLQKVQETLPVVNANVYRDSAGDFHSYEDGEYEELLNDYKILQYNQLVDGKHRVDAFFGS